MKLGSTDITKFYIGSSEVSKIYLGSDVVYEPSGGGASIQDEVSSAVFEVDATDSASYSGSGTTWANLLSSPADGASQTDYDFDVTGSPTFTGTAGDSAAYWAMDGTDDDFRLAGTNTAFLRDMHKTTGGSDFWAAFALRVPDGANRGLFTTMGGASDIGVSGLIRGGDNLRMRQNNGSNNNANSIQTVSDDTDTIIIMSHSHSTNTTRFWVNSSTADDVSQTFNTTTTDATVDLRLGAWGNLGDRLPSGSRFYAAAMGNSYIANADAAAIIAYWNTKHSRTYVA